MRYFVSHQIQFKSGSETAPYRLTRSFKSVRGALTAGERHAIGTEKFYDRASIALHAILVTDECGNFVTNLAA